MESDASLHSSSESGDDADNTLDLDQEAGGDSNGETMADAVPKQGVEEKRKQIQSRCSVKKMYELMDGFGEEKLKLVKEMGFQGILDLPYVSRSNRGFSSWIYQHVDEEASAINNGLRRDIPFNASDFGRVIGIPCGGTPIGTDPGADVIASVRKILGIGDGITEIKCIAKIVTKEHPKAMTKKQRDAFKVAFCICTVTYMLSPMLKGNYFHTFYWGGLRTPELIHMYDWGKLVYDGVLATARRVKAETVGSKKLKSNLTGCTFGLQVLYLDNLHMGDMNKPHDVFPRWKAYTENFINKMISKDQVSGKNAEVKEYGRLVARDPGTVCYSRNIIASATSFGLPGPLPEASRADPLLAQITPMLVERVATYSAACQDTLFKASKKGEELNRRHSEGWALLVSDTNSAIVAATASVLADIKRISDVISQRGHGQSAADQMDECRTGPFVGEGCLDDQNDGVGTCTQNTEAGCSMQTRMTQNERRTDVDDGSPAPGSRKRKKCASWAKTARGGTSRPIELEDEDPSVEALDGLMKGSSRARGAAGQAVVNPQLIVPDLNIAEGDQELHANNEEAGNHDEVMIDEADVSEEEAGTSHGIKL